MKRANALLAISLAATAAAANPPPAAVPSLQLLEFLADWQDPEGHWHDPLELPGNDDEGDNDQPEDHNDDDD